MITDQLNDDPYVSLPDNLKLIVLIQLPEANNHTCHLTHEDVSSKRCKHSTKRSFG